jgi:peroxiredoxin
MHGLDVLLILARSLLASVFGLAGATKLADRDGSRQGLVGFGVPSRLAAPLGLLLPALELTVAVALIPSSTAWWGAIGALGLLLVFLGGIGYSLAQGRTPDCRCFGQLHSAPIGYATVIRNAVLAAVAVFVALAPPFAQPSVIAWAGDLTTAQLLIVVLSLIGVGLQATLVWFLFQIMRQLGDLPQRFEALEMRLGGMVAGAPLPLPDVLGHNGHASTPDPMRGLPVGSTAPKFELPSIDGPTVSLDGLRAVGRPVLLLFVDPNCGPCNALVPDVARWQREHEDETIITIVSRGASEANRAKFSERGVANLLLQHEYEVADAFRAHATPAAVLVRTDGTIGSPVALGPEQIRTLIWSSVLTPLPFVATGGRQERGLTIGEPAPDLSFSDLDGGTVDLADFRGARTLLLFWRNSCGFCQGMLPDLKAWDAHPPPAAPNLVVVSQGTPKENRALGLQSRVVIDDSFAAGEAFGANGTPMAVLLDPNGKVASGLVVGAQAVLSLAEARAPSQPPNG